MAAHSPIGASSMHRWEKCPGSVRECKGVKQFESESAKEGTIAHDKCEVLLAYEILKTKKLAFNKVIEETDQDTLYACYDYVNTIKDDINESGCEPKLDENFFIEHKFDLSSVHPGLFGTADCVFYNEDKKELNVYDYKHGAGHPVDVVGNVQLLYYGLGALLSTGLPCTTVVLTIVQPRCPHPDGPIRRWEVSAMDLMEFSDRLKKAALATEDPDAPLVAGDHCKFCAVAGKCQTLRDLAVKRAMTEFDEFKDDAEKLSEVLKWLPMIEDFVRNVKRYAYMQAVQGKVPLGHKLVEKRATRKWAKTEEETAQDLLEFVDLDVFDTDDFFTKKFKSPAQIEKVIGQKLPETFFIKESSGSVLVSEADARRELANDPADVFNEITVEPS
jgi:hypothetical protein